MFVLHDLKLNFSGLTNFCSFIKNLPSAIKENNNEPRFYFFSHNFELQINTYLEHLAQLFMLII